MTEDINYRKIKNFLRKFSSNIRDENILRKALYKLLYYDINEYPINIKKSIEEINYDILPFPSYFKNIKREEIIEIYNNNVKSNYYKNINIDEINEDYDIIGNIKLEISLKTFRPIYNENWKKISEDINKVEFNKQKSFYAEYLRIYLKLKYFPNFDDFIKYLFNKYQIPVHKDIKNVFENIDKSYENVREYIKINNISYEDVKKILINSTNISNRIIMQD